MGYIAFIAVLFGAAGVVGSIETGSVAGIVLSAALHLAGIIGMEITCRREAEPDEDEEETGVAYLGGSSIVDKPDGVCR